MDFIASITTSVSEALASPDRLPGGLILCGLLEAAGSLAIILFRAPGGVFVKHVLIYFVLLVSVILLGLSFISVGFWVSSDVNGRRAVGKAALWFSLIPLIVILALGFTSAAPLAA